MKLEHRVVLITGGSRGIGRCVAEGFAREGASLYIVGNRDRDGLEATLERLRALGAQADGGLYDIGKQDDARRIADAVERRFGALDVLVNNAGTIHPTPLIEISAEQWERTLRTHLYGTVFCTVEMVRRFFQRRGSGKVVNVTSLAATRPTYGLADYGTAKGGVEAFTRAAAKELLGMNVQVNAISPVGYTRMVDDLIDSARRASAPEPVIEKLKSVPPPEKLLPVFLFFASAESDHVTGQILTADGGFLLDS